MSVSRRRGERNGGYSFERSKNRQNAQDLTAFPNRSARSRETAREPTEASGLKTSPTSSRFCRSFAVDSAALGLDLAARKKSKSRATRVERSDDKKSSKSVFRARNPKARKISRSKRKKQQRFLRQETKKPGKLPPPRNPKSGENSYRSKRKNEKIPPRKMKKAGKVASAKKPPNRRKFL